NLCPKCSRFLAELHDLATEGEKKPEPQQFETKTSTLSSKFKGKVKIKEKPLDISLDHDMIELRKEEYVKLLGITSVDRTQLFCSNKKYNYLLELTNNLDFIARDILGGGVLDKMSLISVEQNTEEKCQFLVEDEIIYLAYGRFPDKKGIWLLEQLSKNYSELVKGKDVNKLEKFENYRIENEIKKRTKAILTEYVTLQDVFGDQVIGYVDDSIQIDYLGLSSLSIGIISLLIGSELNVELQMEVESLEEEREMKESMLTARIEAIAANTQGNTGAFPRWIAVKLDFQQYRFLTFKKYQNDYFLSLLSEGNLEHIEKVEQLLDQKIGKVLNSPFSGNLKPFNRLKLGLEEDLTKRRRFPPFNFS
ncbi:MAG: hypothetical protein ACW99L_14170, partial [Promethearchaeota archaeon]